ncbi:MAG: DUF2905 domain-containing protein [Candidatus Glassbacteria bacterium]
MNVNLGRLMVFFGLALAVVGLVLMFGPKIPWLGRLPGDIVIRRENFSFYFPLTTCIIISLVLTLLARLFKG